MYQGAWKPLFFNRMAPSMKHTHHLHVLTPNAIRELEQGFRQAWEKAINEGRRTISEDRVEFECDVFIGLIDRWANGGVQDFMELENRKQKDRKRAMAQVATAALKLSEALNNLDSDAAGWLMSKFAEQHEGKEFAEQFSHVRFYLMAEEQRPKVITALNDLNISASRARADMPPSETKAALQMALGLERQFWELGFDFAASATSYASRCLEILFEAGGLKKTSMQYWIDQAKNHPDSMTSWTLRNTAAH